MSTQFFIRWLVTMTKYDWLWVTLRAAGIYLLVQAALALPNALGYTGMMIWWKLDGTLSEIGRTSALYERTVQWATTSSIQVAVYSVLGFYFLLGGRWLLRLAAGSDGVPLT